MTTPVDVCNRAISEIGGARGKTITALTDGSTPAVQCSLWYDNLRRRLLRTAPWAFARRQVGLTLLGDLVPDQTSPWPFLFKYAYPTDCLKLRYVLPPPPPSVAGVPQVGEPLAGWGVMVPSRQCRFLLHNDVDAGGSDRKVILTNVQQAIGVYTGDVTNPDLWDPLFEGALVTALASKLVIPLSGNVGEKKDMEALVDRAILDARVVDGNESITKSDPRVDWIEARGVGAAWGAGPWSGTGASSSWGQWYSGYDNANWSM